jgi:hypothetical protein
LDYHDHLPQSDTGGAFDISDGADGNVFLRVGNRHSPALRLHWVPEVVMAAGNSDPFPTFSFQLLDDFSARHRRSP